MATGNSQDIKKPAPQRLLSLRGERDLTLGALTLNNKKKNFCPVLPSQAKPKVKQEIVSEFAPPPEVKLKPGVLQRNDRTKPNVKDAGRGRGRGRGSSEPNVDNSQFIQMKSVFSEGPMMAQARVSNSCFYSGGSRGGEKTVKEEKKASSSSVAKGRDKGEEAMEWEADTKDVLEQLLRDDFISDQSSSGSSEHDMDPVCLPVSLSHRLDVKAKQKVKHKVPRPMKRIKDDDEKEVSVMTHQSGSSVLLSSARLQPAEIFAADSALQSELLLFQLPDVLPGVPFSKATGQKTKTNPGSHEALKCSLSDFEENAVGRLVVRQSGRTQLVLGNVAFDISAGSSSACLQDLASLRVDEGCVGSLTVLGHVQHKLLCIPNLTSLLNTGHSSS